MTGISRGSGEMNVDRSTTDCANNRAWIRYPDSRAHVVEPLHNMNDEFELLEVSTLTHSIHLPRAVMTRR